MAYSWGRRPLREGNGDNFLYGTGNGGSEGASKGGLISRSLPPHTFSFSMITSRSIFFFGF